MGKIQIKAGNQCIFSMFIVLNCVMFVAGLATVALGIVIFVREKQSDAYDWGFIGTGIGMSLMSLMGC